MKIAKHIQLLFYYSVKRLGIFFIFRALCALRLETVWDSYQESYQDPLSTQKGLLMLKELFNVSIQMKLLGD